MTIKLLLVDDQNLVRMGICSLLEITGKINVVAELDDGSGVLDAITNLQPDIILLDIRMPKMDGLQVLAAMAEKQIHVPVLVLTTFDEHELILKCMALGAKGYLRKDISLESLVAAIDTVAAGETWLQPAITTKVMENSTRLLRDTHFNQDDSLIESPIEKLTAKELQVIRLVAAGFSNHEISIALHKSPGTIRNTVSSILAKLQVRDRTRAVLKAIDYKLI
ncbi:MAG: response regulator transcription factor [Bermanella sp.]